MYQFSSTSGSVNYRDENERENINSKLAEFQEQQGKCNSFKELFEQLIEVALQHAHKIETVPVYPENALLIGENKNDLDQFTQLVEDFRQSASLAESYTTENVLCAAISLAKNPEIKTETVEVPAELPENALIIRFSDEPSRPAARKFQILQTIQENRQKKYRLPEPESLPAVVEKLVFSEGALFNHGGDVFTGF